MRLRLLVTPLARGAYFAQTLDVALAELGAHFPQADAAHARVGDLDFVDVELPEAALATLARLSFVQGIFATDDSGALTPLEASADFAHPDDLVWGAKYAGKTNELVTQLAINLALCHADPGARPRERMTLLDPMAGRGTTLLWASRYGLEAHGLEQDRAAIGHLQRHVKKQTKLHRIKHTQSSGFVGKKNKLDVGKFIEYGLGGKPLRLTIGRSENARELLPGKTFDLVVSDLPYGIQHTGKGGKRNPLDVLRECAPGWVESMRPGGAMVLVFNALMPRRNELEEVFTSLELVSHDAGIAHRMSESILRDALVLTKPR